MPNLCRVSEDLRNYEAHQATLLENETEQCPWCSIRECNEEGVTCGEKPCVALQVQDEWRNRLGLRAEELSSQLARVEFALSVLAALDQDTIKPLDSLACALGTTLGFTDISIRAADLLTLLEGEANR